MIHRKLLLESTKSSKGTAGGRRYLNYVLIGHLLTLWIIGALSVKDIPISHVVAIAGEPTYLPCDISTNHDGDSVHLVLWYRDNLDTSVYSLDARGRDFEIAQKWSDNTVFSNRASFLQNKQPALLGVDQIREEDAGMYRCRVDFQIGQTRNSKVNLTVIVPPQEIVISDKKGIERKSVIGPYSEGDDLELFCDVFGGKPQPTVAWYRNNKYVNNETMSVANQVVRSAIMVKNLGRDDANLELTCTATNNNRSTPLSSTVRVNINLRPLKVEIIGSNEALSAGKNYKLVCATYGSRPPANVTWWRDGIRFDANFTNSVSEDGNMTTSILSFRPTKMDTGSRLSCRAENPIMKITPIEDEWILKIHYKPESQIKLGKSLNKDAIREGTDVYFDCKINAEPSVYKVEWRHEGKTLNHNVTQGIIISNRSLVLQKVDRKSAGNYTCVGYNTEGDGESSAFYLRVMFAPTCKANQENVHGVAKQEKANISCQVDANPSDVTFRWTFNNSAESIEVGGDHVTRSGTTSIVSYTPITALDYGTLLCWASNVIGDQQIPCVYHIIPAGHPDMVHNCSISNTSTSSFTVRCSEGFNGGLHQSFLVEVRESNSQQIRRNVTGPVPHFSITHLEPGALYQAVIYAYNSKGRSEPMVVQAGTLRLPEKQLTAETERPRHHVKLTPMLSVMIGVIAALVIVAVIVTIVLRIQNASPDEHGKSHLDDHDKVTKTIPIQRELRFRECSSLLTEEKMPDSPYRKSENTGDLSEPDEKNPDIIPQQINGGEEGVDAAAAADYSRKRRLVSTIDTSPSRSILKQHPLAANPLPPPPPPSSSSSSSFSSSHPPLIVGHGNYVGYCTIRNRIPLQEFSGLSTRHKSVSSMVQSVQKTSALKVQPMVSEHIYGSGVCTLPRQHWPSPNVPTISPAPILYTVSSRSTTGSTIMPKELVESRPRHGQCCLKTLNNKELVGSTTTPGHPGGGTPIVMKKRESSV